MKQLAFLNNPKGRVHLQPTHPVAVSYRFFHAFKRIEEQYDYNRDQFQIRRDGRGRLLHHITKSDIQLFITVQTVFNTKGKLDFCNRNRIYQKQAELFEEPVTNDQFYVSFQKFVEHGLLQLVKDEITGTYHYTLNEYLQDDTETIGYYFLLPPAVFTQAFYKLPLAAQKWYLEGAAQQNDNPSKVLEKNLRADGKDGGLYSYLHKTNLNQIQQLLDVLTRTPVWDGQPLFAPNSIIKPNSTGYYKASYAINPYFIIPKQKGTLYHEVIKPKKTYRRVASFIKAQLSRLGIGELEEHNEGQTIIQLVNILKKKSHSFIRYVLLKIKELHSKHLVFPVDFIRFIKEEVHNKGMAIYLDIAKKTGIYSFIAPKSLDDWNRRSTEFTAAMSRFDLNTFRKLCQAAKPILVRQYSRMPVLSPVGYKRGNEQLERWMGRAAAEDIHTYAYQLQVDLREYRMLEERALQKLHREAPHEVKQWMLDEIRQLPKWEPIPDVPHGFKVEELLAQLYSPSH
ncbi:hypothetical protein [Paenibacillus sp. 32352]|uniref:hypothetical protein n=1 Tax=Paenibacillus sp. 32352 TaxID=1969111 RepID=UPI0009ADBAD9|nr:hypothetical protein [Paenibacillus sp. 32352]